MNNFASPAGTHELLVWAKNSSTPCYRLRGNPQWIDGKDVIEAGMSVEFVGNVLVRLGGPYADVETS